MVNAVVLAGTDKNPKRLINGRNKAFLRIGGWFVVSYVLDALKNAKAIDEIAIVGPEKGLEEIKSINNKVIILKERGSLLENALYGYRELKRVREDNHTFFITGDIPLITKNAIDRFIVDCKSNPQNSGADVYFPIVRKETMGQYNELKRPYVKLKDGEYRISNFILANVRKIENLGWIDDIFNGRVLKTVRGKLRLASYFPDIFWRYYFSRNLTLNYIENKASDILGAKVKLVETKHPETSLDIDTEKDFEYIRSIMLKRAYEEREKRIFGANVHIDKVKQEKIDYYNNAVNGIKNKPFENLYPMVENKIRKNKN